MTDREAFLTRWSRRKREAAATGAEPIAEETAVPRVAENEKSEPPNVPPVPASQPTSEVELPPIESINAGTDVRAFLEDGVPQDLARAALRRAWNSDPAIRDFVGLSENAWDFNDPHAMPGFGPLDCSEEQLGALLDRIVGGVRGAADSLTTATAEQQNS